MILHIKIFNCISYYLNLLFYEGKQYGVQVFNILALVILAWLGQIIFDETIHINIVEQQPEL